MLIPDLIPQKELRIGILGGTFDPIHKGHIETAKQVLNQYKLDKILVIPAHKPPHKSGTIASTIHRVSMVELTCANESRFELDTRETKRTNLSYTSDTIKELNAEYPSSRLFFIMGMDSLLNFTRWHLWEDILKGCSLIVNTRPGYDLSSVNTETKALLARYQSTIAPKELSEQTTSASLSANKSYIFLHKAEEVDISSTQIRQHIANNIDCSQWLPMNVIKYIKDNNLYKV